MWWESDFQKCEHCQSVEEKWEFRKLAKTDKSGNIKFFEECPVCGNLVEIDSNSINKYEKEELIKQANQKDYTIFIVIGFWIIISLLWSYSPKLLITIGITIFAFFIMLNPL